MGPFSQEGGAAATSGSQPSTLAMEEEVAQLNTKRGRLGKVI